MKKKTGKKVITVILVVIVCMFALFPFVWMISTSFKTAGEVYSKTPSFIPKEATIQGYKDNSIFDGHCNTWRLWNLQISFPWKRIFILFHINHTGASRITVDYPVIGNYG